VSLHNNAAFGLTKDFLRSVLNTENPWLASQANELDIWDKVWHDALDAMTVWQRVVGTLNSTQHVWEQPGGPSEHIDALTHGIVSFQSIHRVSKFNNTNYQCNTVAGENQW
jgi:hypothetical protein